MEFNIPAMSCGHCAGVITQTVKALDPSAQVKVDLAAKKVVVESSRDRPALAAALAEAGYPAQ
ncbi:heavy-metal-associated domain-containing protein [Polaromonas sp. YR568]|uniref:heavy-metal-associated domain-containing protein n=1 Tax=Polaromonas sp. YR568 TaxID=1855301 RepID=UPI00398C0113